MNDDKLIKKILKRLDALESKLASLESNHSQKSEEDKISFKPTMSRNEARKYIMDRFVDYNSGYNAMKGKRDEGSGIILLHEDKDRLYKVKFFHSNNHRDDRLFGWHKVKKEHVESSFQFYVFTIYWRSKVYPFVFSHDELHQLIKKKQPTDNDYYHFYFEMNHGKFYETRDKVDDLGFDVSEYFNRWRRLETYMALEVITDQDKVHKKIASTKFLSGMNGLILLEDDKFPKTHQKTILVKDQYPSQEWDLEKELVDKIDYVLVEVIIKDENSNEVLDIVDDVTKKFAPDQTIYYLATVNYKNRDKINTFIVLENEKKKKD